GRFQGSSWTQANPDHSVPRGQLPAFAQLNRSGASAISKKQLCRNPGLAEGEPARCDQKTERIIPVAAVVTASPQTMAAPVGTEKAQHISGQPGDVADDQLLPERETGCRQGGQDQRGEHEKDADELY